VTPVVFVVDDDVSVRESLEAIIDFARLRAETYVCAQHFLKRTRDKIPSRLVMDVMLPDHSGLDL
jgi:FixJ family two-component response regulator